MDGVKASTPLDMCVDRPKIIIHSLSLFFLLVFRPSYLYTSTISAAAAAAEIRAESRGAFATLLAPVAPKSPGRLVMVL